MSTQSMLKVAPKTKPGRPKVTGQRYPGGQLKSREELDKNPPALIRRTIDKALAEARNPILASSVGWLRLHSILTDTQTSAAVEYARFRGQYDAFMQYPRRSPKGSCYGDAFGKSLKLENVKSIQRLRNRWERLIAEVTLTDRELLDRVCVDDLHPTAWELEGLLKCLNKLTIFFNLTGRRK